MSRTTRRSLVIGDELWARIQKAAADTGAREGAPISVSEWIRRQCERALVAAPAE